MFSKKLAVLTAVVIVSACSDAFAPMAPSVAPATPMPPVARFELAGIVEVNSSGAWLRTSGGAVALRGEPAEPILTLNGAEITAIGTMDAVNELYVETFRVVRVSGRTVLDGRVVRNGEKISIRLANGDVVDIADPPTGLENHIGHRIWLAPKTEEKPAEFGVIQV